MEIRTIKAVALALTILALDIGFAQKLQGPLTYWSTNENGVLVTELIVPSVQSEQVRYTVDNSRSALKTHSFSLDGVECVAQLKNSTTVPAVVFCEGGAPYDVHYPGGECFPKDLLDGLTNGQIFYIAFSGQCHPLRVHVTSSTPLQATVLPDPQARDLPGEVVVLQGENEYEDEEIVYGFLQGTNEVGLKFSNAINYIPAADIGIGQSTCSTITSLLRLPTQIINPTTLGLIVNCADSAGTHLRFLAFYGAYEGAVVHVDSVSEAGGEAKPSDNGGFLAVSLDSDNVHSLLLYDVSNMEQTPATINFDTPIRTHFMEYLNETVLAVFRVGSNVLLIYPGLFTSSFGVEGHMEVPNTTVSANNPFPYASFLAGDYFIVPVFDTQTHQFNLSYSKMGSDVVSTIPRVSSTPPVVLFSQLQPIPDPGNITPTQGSLETTPTEATTTEPGTEADASTGVPSWVWAVLGSVVFIAFVLVLAITFYQLCNKNSWCRKSRKNDLKLPLPVQDTKSADRQTPPIEETSPFCVPSIQVSNTHFLHPTPAQSNSTTPTQSNNASPLMTRHDTAGHQ